MYHFRGEDTSPTPPPAPAIRTRETHSRTTGWTLIETSPIPPDGAARETPAITPGRATGINLSILLIAALPLLAGCGSNGASSPPPTATPTPPPTHVLLTATPTGGCAAASTDGNGGPYPAATTSDCTGTTHVEVDVVADPKIFGGFAPSNITIRAGTTVTWVWKAGGHNLYPFHDGVEDTGYRFSKTFATPGVYHYQCQIHTGQNGIIYVR